MISSFSRSRLAGLLALPLLALVLASCGDSGSETVVAEAPATAAPASAATAASPATPVVAAPKSLGSVDMADVLKPNPLPDMAIGQADAPVTIVEYASMTCPHCASFHATTLPELKTKYIDTGKARLIFREFPFPRDAQSEAGFMLARCSGDKYFAMVDVLFRQQNQWAGAEGAKSALLQLAKLAGFSQEKFETCLTDQKLVEDIRKGRDRADTEFGVTSTPTFFINGQKYAGVLSIDEMSAIIDSVD